MKTKERKEAELIDSAWKLGMTDAADIAGKYLQSMGTKDGMKMAALIKKDIEEARDGA